MLQKLQYTLSPPPDLLAARSVALYDYRYTQEELNNIQATFQLTGIDPVVYFESDQVFAGVDASRAFLKYLLSREIRYLIFLEKDGDYRFVVTPFNQQSTWVDVGQAAWEKRSGDLSETMSEVYRVAANSQKRLNLLIADEPETGIAVNPIAGQRGEYFAVDLRIDNLVIVRSGDKVLDDSLQQFFQKHYPFKYQFAEAGSDERELRRQGNLYILCWMHCRGKSAKELLGYDLSKAESVYTSVTYPLGSGLQLRTLSADQVIYKFYFRHLENGRVLLGTKWDADTSPMAALRNHIEGLKTELKLR